MSVPMSHDQQVFRSPAIAQSTTTGCCLPTLFYCGLTNPNSPHFTSTIFAALFSLLPFSLFCSILYRRSRAGLILFSITKSGNGVGQSRQRVTAIASIVHKSSPLDPLIISIYSDLAHNHYSRTEMPPPLVPSNSQGRQRTVCMRVWQASSGQLWAETVKCDCDEMSQPRW